MPDPDGALLSYIIDHDALNDVRARGIGAEHFIHEHEAVYHHLLHTYERDGKVPSASAVLTRFPRYMLYDTDERDVPDLVHQLVQRKKYKDFLALLNTASSTIRDFESVDDVMAVLQAELNHLMMQSGTSHRLVNPFDAETVDTLVREMRKRRAEAESNQYVKTGLATFDRRNGGLSKQKMVVIIGRTGLGKSWLDLLFVAQALIQGKNVVLYPLEMTLFDTACRLYTILTQEMFGPSKVLKNLDLTMGTVNTRKVRRFLTLLEQRLPGKVEIADMAATTDQYTNERIEADVSVQRPDMFWVDYLTLLKAPRGIDARKDYEVVRQLSNGIKATAMRCDTIGGCSAQVNREALKTMTFIPRLEHISYGDSIGQDADLVFSINRRRGHLYYKLVKNRSGAEIGQRKVTWQPNEGYFHEVRDDDAEEQGE